MKEIEMSCESHLEYFRESFIKDEEWAVKLLDSWQKFSSKPLISNLLNFGPFTDCLNFQQNLNSSEIQGQHCLISYSSILSHNFDDTSNEYEIDSIIEKETFVLKNGICLPSSCSMSEIENFLRNHLKETDIIVLNSYCQTKEKLSINVLDIFVLFTFIALILITSICTYFDLKYRGKKFNNKFLKAFSAYENFKCLSKYAINERSIECVNGLKVLSAIWIIIGHRMDMIIENSNVIREFMSSEERLILRISEMFTSVVDIFFLISGLLVAIKCLRLFKEHNFSFMKHCSARFLRFLPVLAIIIAFFMSTWPKMLANGPQTIEFKEELEDCKKNWLRSLLLVGNFNSNFCLRHTWYTSTDFQLFIISPAIVYGLFKFKRKFLKIIAFIIVVGQINIFVHKLSDIHEEFYYEAYYRFMPWFIGIMLGYNLESKQDAKGIDQNIKTFGWTATIISLSLIEFIRFQEKSKFSEALYEATHRIIWSNAFAWIIYACHHNKSSGFLMNFLSHRIWNSLARMCLSIYLVHYLVVMLSFVNMKNPYQFDVLWLLKILLLDIFMSLIISFIFYILVEAPMCRIVKTFERKNYYVLVENR
ncbi:hypothetical protein ACKWTF_005887 [Chironomus riparius]